MKIFILEDDEERIRLFEQAAQGKDLTVCRDLARAAQMYEPPYDVILLDHDLGGRVMVDSLEEETGASFCRWLGANHPTPEASTLTVVHSWNPDGAREMLRLLREIGWQGVTACPFGVPLLSTLRRL